MHKQKKFVPVYFENGTKGKIDLSSIPLDKWTPYHGTANDGTKVNSLVSTKIGLSTILMNPDNGAAISVHSADLEVFAAKFAAANGYQVTAKPGLRDAA